MSKGYSLLLATLVAIGILFALFMSWCTSKALAYPEPTHDSLTATYTYDGDIIRIYSVTDSDTGIEYLVSDHGGITPRLEKTND